MSASDCSKAGARGSRGRRLTQASKGDAITLRHGAVLLQNLTLEEARVLTNEFSAAGGVASGFFKNSQCCDRLNLDARRPDTVLEDAQASAKHLLESILVAFPRLGGQAANSFGTALRVEAVRAEFEKVMIRPQLPLLRTLGHIANAADAGRHLSSQLVQESTMLAISSLGAMNNNDAGCIVCVSGESTAQGDSRSVAVGTDVPLHAVQCFSLGVEDDECSARDVEDEHLSTAASGSVDSLDASEGYSDDVISELASLDHAGYDGGCDRSIVAEKHNDDAESPGPGGGIHDDSLGTCLGDAHHTDQGGCVSQVGTCEDGASLGTLDAWSRPVLEHCKSWAAQTLDDVDSGGHHFDNVEGMVQGSQNQNAWGLMSQSPECHGPRTTQTQPGCASDSVGGERIAGEPADCIDAVDTMKVDHVDPGIAHSHGCIQLQCLALDLATIVKEFGASCGLGGTGLYKPALAKVEAAFQQLESASQLGEERQQQNAKRLLSFMDAPDRDALRARYPVLLGLRKDARRKQRKGRR